MSQPIIGRLDWNACDNCRHSPLIEGGCNREDELDELIYTEYDDVLCHGFEDRKLSETETEIGRIKRIGSELTMPLPLDNAEKTGKGT